MAEPLDLYAQLQKLHANDATALGALLLYDGLEGIRGWLEHLVTAVEGIDQLAIKIEEVSKSINSLEDEIHRR